MLEVRVKQPDEVLLERKLRNPLGVVESETRPRTDFFRNKMKDMINYHLDYAKFRKKIISEEDLEKIQKYEESDTPKRVYHKKSKSALFEMKPEPKQLRDALLSKVSCFEKISGLVKSAERVTYALSTLEDLNSSSTYQTLTSKLESLSQIFSSLQKITSEEQNSFHYLLTLLDTITKKQSSESSTTKKDLQEKHLKDLQTISQKYENRIQGLLEHNKALSSQKKENKLLTTFKQRIESLESLLSSSEKRVSEKSDQIKTRSSEINSLNQALIQKDEEIIKLKKDLKDLDDLNSLDRDSYRNQIHELNVEVARVKQSCQESLVANEMKMAELQYLADSHRFRMEQAIDALSKADEHLEYFKQQAAERERIIENENFELRKEVERLDRITFNLKDEVESVSKNFEVQQLQMSRSKEDEISQLSKIIEKLEMENGNLMKSNKELSVMNNKLESEIFRSKESKSLKTSKTEKKIKKK
jgi:hypothetical protein